MPEFEFDPLKSAKNKWKHGIALADAARWWNRDDRLFFPAKPVKGESRHALFTHDQGRLWAVIFALRGGKIRLISARPAGKEERARYYDEGI
jgi:uncharacterized DUF497 family protein